MSARAQAKFHVRSWDEAPILAVDGGSKVTRAQVATTLAGDLEGTRSIEYVMAYGAGGGATFVFSERVACRVGGRSGTFVVQGQGSFDPAEGVAKGSFAIVPGSGSGDLSSIRGTGSFAAPHGPDGTYTLDYDLD